MDTSRTIIPTIEKQELKTKRINRIINYFMKDQQRNKYVKIMDDLLKGYVIGYQYNETKRKELYDLTLKKGKNRKNTRQLKNIINKKENLLRNYNKVVNENIKSIATIIKNNYIKK